ncbi:hypothetical protein INQ64_24725, partial [Escherichia coli]
PLSLFTHPGVFAPGIAPAHAGQAMQWQYRTVEAGEGEGECLAKLGKLGNLLGKSGKLLGAKLGALLSRTKNALKNTYNVLKK